MNRTDRLLAIVLELQDYEVRTTEIAQRLFGSIFTVTAPDRHIVTMLKEPDTI